MKFLEDLKTLVECESPSSDLDACNRVVDTAILIANRLSDIPARKLFENGRPIFWWGAKEPKIFLLAHLDTVWPVGSFVPSWSVEGDIVQGPGVFDMKAGFIQGLYAVQGIPEASRDVAIIGTTDEEIESVTSRDLIERVAKKARYSLVLEPSFHGKLKTRRKGSSQYQILVHGLAAHAGLEPEKGVNSTVEVSKIVCEIINLANIEFNTTVTPTTLRSGTTTNTIPSLAILDIDCRSFEISELNRIDKSLRSLKPSNQNARIEIIGGIVRPPLEFKSSEELYARFEKVASRLGYSEIGHASVGGVSDGNLTASIGALTLDGLGAVGDGAHALTEHVILSTIAPRIELLNAFLSDLLDKISSSGTQH
jgi:glutamate carboxypeptidase